MPRHANATSYGGERGNRPVGGDHGGRPIPEVFRKTMAVRASREASIRRLDKMLASEDDEVFLKAWKECADRGFGKAPQSLDVTSGGQPLLDALTRRSRILALLASADAVEIEPPRIGAIGPAEAVGDGGD